MSDVPQVLLARRWASQRRRLPQHPKEVFAVGALPQRLGQALHIGSYDDEGPLLASLHDEIMPAGGYDFAGDHHDQNIAAWRSTVRNPPTASKFSSANPRGSIRA